MAALVTMRLDSLLRSIGRPDAGLLRILDDARFGDRRLGRAAHPYDRGEGAD